MPYPSLRSRRTVLGLLAAVPVAAGGLLAAPGSAAAEPARHGRIPRDLLPGGRFDRFVAELAASDRFSGTVLLAHRGRPVLFRSHGTANQQRSIPNRSDTSFDVASITKCFTAVAIGQLAAQGSVAFHETLGTYLDGFPADVARVTVHQLLTHTSGAGRSPMNPPQPPGAEEWDTVEEVWNGTMAFLRTLPLRFTPGTQYGYSNDGYFMLGAIVAQVSGLSYYDYVRRHIFAPAGLTDTDFYTRPQVIADDTIARGYATQPSGGRVDITTTRHFGFVGGPASGAYSSAPDMLRFTTALHAGRLLAPAFTHLLTSGKVPNQSFFYGYGHLDAIVGGQRIVGHPGGAPGRANNLDVFPDLGWVAIVLSNYDDSIRPIVDLARELITQG